MLFVDRTVVVGRHVVGERGLQFGVSEAYVQGVGVRQCVGYEVGNAGLAGVAVVAEVQLFGAAEHVAEVDGRRGIEDGAAHIVVLRSFGVVDAVDLRLQVGTDGQAVERTVHAQLQTDVVVLVDIGGVVALVDVGCGQVGPLPIVVDAYIM